MNNPRLYGLAEQWRSEACVFRLYQFEQAAAFLEIHAQQLEAELLASRDQELTLAEAALESGYSVDHLGRLIRSGRLENVGRKHAPRVRRGDLPTKLADAKEMLASGDGTQQATDGLFRDIMNSKRRRK